MKILDVQRLDDFGLRLEVEFDLPNDVLPYAYELSEWDGASWFEPRSDHVLILNRPDVGYTQVMNALQQWNAVLRGHYREAHDRLCLKHALDALLYDDETLTLSFNDGPRVKLERDGFEVHLNVSVHDDPHDILDELRQRLRNQAAVQQLRQQLQELVEPYNLVSWMLRNDDGFQVYLSTLTEESKYVFNTIRELRRWISTECSAVMKDLQERARGPNFELLYTQLTTASR